MAQVEQRVAARLPRRGPARRLAAFTLPELLTALAVLVAVGCVLLPALATNRDDARVAHCANNLRLLSGAALAHAFENDGKFFPHHLRFQQRKPDGPEPQDTRQWFDADVVGEYLRGEPLMTNYARVPIGSRAAVPRPYGLGLGVFLCPSDDADPARSYDMNAWASSLPAGEDYEQSLGGQFFDANADEIDRLLLFSDVIGATPTDKGWATAGTLGLQPARWPGGRFGGAIRYTDTGFTSVLHRFENIETIFSELDYFRHGGERVRNPLAPGAVNIALADGHVSLYENADLYAMKGQQGRQFSASTLQVLWSPNDSEVQAKFNEKVSFRQERRNQ